MPQRSAVAAMIVLGASAGFLSYETQNVPYVSGLLGVEFPLLRRLACGMATAFSVPLDGGFTLPIISHRSSYDFFLLVSAFQFCPRPFPSKRSGDAVVRLCILTDDVSRPSA